MHAASVHPEPGSNSRKIYIISNPQRIGYNLSSSYSFLASFTLLSIYNSFDEIHTHFILLCTYLLLFNFQWPSLSSRGQLDYYTTSFLLCQYLFSNFFEFFSRSLRWGIFASALLSGSYILPPFSPFVNTFFWFFVVFYSLHEKLCFNKHYP